MAINAYSSIASTTLTATSSTVTFSSIPSTYSDLVVVMQLASNNNAYAALMQFNNDTGQTYSHMYFQGDGTTVRKGLLVYPSTLQTGAAFSWFTTPGTSSNKSFIAIININDYAGTKKKNWIARNTNPNNSETYRGTELIAGAWLNTSAISEIDFIVVGSAYYESGSTFSLYGITKA